MSKSIIDTLGKLERRVTKQRHVLIVDDAPMDREILNFQLTQLGCVCEEASDCQGAHGKAKDFRFDVCIMDLRMPGLDGLSCARQLKESHPDIRVVLCTGYPDEIQAEDLKSAGVLTLLSKPTSSEDLQRMLREFNL